MQEVLPGLQAFGDLDDYTSPFIVVKRRIHRPRQRRHPYRLAQVLGVEKLRLAGDQRLRRQRQLGVADLGQAVFGRHPVVHVAVGGQFEELQHQVGLFERQSPAGCGYVVVDGSQRSGKRAVVGDVDLVAQLLVGQPQGSGHDENQRGNQPPQQHRLQRAMAGFFLPTGCQQRSPGNSPCRAW
ncbi:Uncharacterised protein [Bordetella pertussis]|nr:Uncharacterised protein [Bordetella pertussis]